MAAILICLDIVLKLNLKIIIINLVRVLISKEQFDSDIY